MFIFRRNINFNNFNNIYNKKKICSTMNNNGGNNDDILKFLITICVGSYIFYKNNL